MSTTFTDIERRFHSMFQDKHEVPKSLEAEWLKIAVAEYELNVGGCLHYDDVSWEFEHTLSNVVCNTLADYMYMMYLERELSRVSKLNSIHGKDIQVSGQDATKYVTRTMLEAQRAKVETLYEKQKVPAYS